MLKKYNSTHYNYVNQKFADAGKNEQKGVLTATPFDAMQAMTNVPVFSFDSFVVLFLDYDCET